MNEQGAVKVSYPTWQWRFWHGFLVVSIGIILTLIIEGTEEARVYCALWGALLALSCKGSALLGLQGKKEGKGPDPYKVLRGLGFLIYVVFVYGVLQFMMAGVGAIGEIIGLNTWSGHLLIIVVLSLIFTSWIEVIVWGWPPRKKPFLILARAFPLWAKLYLKFTKTGRRVSKGAKWLVTEKKVNLSAVNWLKVDMKKGETSILFLALPEIRNMSFPDIFQQLEGESFGFWRHSWCEEKDGYAGTNRLTRAWQILLRAHELKKRHKGGEEL